MLNYLPSLHVKLGGSCQTDQGQDSVPLHAFVTHSPIRSLLSLPVWRLRAGFSLWVSIQQLKEFLWNSNHRVCTLRFCLHSVGSSEAVTPVPDKRLCSSYWFDPSRTERLFQRTQLLLQSCHVHFPQIRFLKHLSVAPDIFVQLFMIAQGCTFWILSNYAKM